MKKILKINIILAIIILILYFSLYIYAYFQKKLSITLANNYYFYDSNNDVYNANDNNWVKLEEISPYLINATISTEDKHFYNHLGFDYLRILKALTNNIKNRNTIEGASTITQQYAKNLFLGFEKTWTRKLQEAWITIQLESQYKKEEILEGYLNTINYGGIFGIENAAMYYFNKHAKDLTLAESTILAGIPKSPSYYSPITNEKNAKKRQLSILENMVKNKYITKDEKEKAKIETLTYIGSTENTKITSLLYYQDAVLNELQNIKEIPPSFLKTKGLKIYTTLNMEYQKILDEKTKNNTQENEEIQIAAVILEPSSTHRRKKL